MYKVLFISRGPSPYRVDFFNELGKFCDLTVLFELNPIEIRDRNLEWFHENYDNFRGFYLRYRLPLKNERLCFGILPWLLKHRNYDFIILQQYSTPTQMLAIILLKLLKIKYVLNSDGGFIKKENIFFKLIKMFFIKGATFYFASSNDTLKYLKHYGADNIYLYPFTTFKRVDMLNKEVYLKSKTQIKERLKMNERIIILSVGQFVYRKGFDILLRACRDIHSSAGVYIIGGYATQEYLEIVKNFNLRNVHFISFKEKKELEEYYCASDIFVLPTREDIWGLVINEAMLYGLPIVTTNNCLAGKEMIIDFENGFVVPVEDVETLQCRINYLIDNDYLRNSIANKNILKIQNYTIENMTKVHVETLALENQNNTSNQ